MTTEQKFECFAVVELMGHNIIAGYISEQTIAGIAMLRVDVPSTATSEPFTKFFGGSAVYGITPTTEEIVARAAQRLAVRPVEPWVVPDPSRQSALVDSTAGEEEEYGYALDSEEERLF